MTKSSIGAVLRKLILIAEFLIAFLVVFVAIGMKIMSAQSFYRLGLDPSLPNHLYTYLPEYFLGYLLFIFIAVILLGVGLFIQIRRFGFNNSFLHICCITVAVLTIVICIATEKPGIKYTIEGFTERVQRYMDVEEIRQWAESYDVNNQTLYDGVDESNWPPTLRRLAPNAVHLEKATNSDYEVYAVWGGPFGHWGLVVGPENMPFSGSETHRGDEWRAEFSEGVYIWYEIR